MIHRPDGPSRFALLVGLGAVLALAGPAAAQTGAVVGGSADVTVGGIPVARQGDNTAGPGGAPAAPIAEGSPDVLIGGKPAATAGSRTGCGGAVTGGSANVFVNGKPLARAGDATGGC